MATKIEPDKITRNPKKIDANSRSAPSNVVKCVQVLASLKLTATLLAMSVFIVLAAAGLILVYGMLYLIHWRKSALPCQPMPTWGWWAIGIWPIMWILAWTRFSWFAGLQSYTFAPLWLSFIVVINALTFQRSGRCLLTHERGYLIKLFLFSALFWWYFEFLNRFVQNWYYAGLAPGGPLLYISSSTIAFATVLPGVISMCELLATFPQFATSHYRRQFRFKPMPVAFIMLLMATIGLLLIGIYPNALFPLLWMAPLLLIVALQLLTGHDNLLSACARGEWYRLSIPMLAALICGCFWELWNFYSMAVWHYALPYVDRFHLFEMPILGYAGYLPFVLECMAVSQLLRRTKPPVQPDSR